MSKDQKMDWMSMEISLVNIIGYTREDFHDMTLVEIVNAIRTYKKMNPVDDNKKSKNNKQQKATTSSERFSFGRAPELDR